MWRYRRRYGRGRSHSGIDGQYTGEGKDVQYSKHDFRGKARSHNGVPGVPGVMTGGL
jgi:hypothetical protein